MNQTKTKEPPSLPLSPSLSPSPQDELNTLSKRSTTSSLLFTPSLQYLPLDVDVGTQLTIEEGDEPGKEFTFTVALNTMMAGDLTIDLSLSDPR